jgi:hypothetical protein
LFYARQRYFDPALGKWISADPIGFDGGLNLYGYTGQNPTNLADPDGLMPIDDWWFGMCQEDRRATAQANAQAGTWAAEQLAWQAVGGVVMRGLGLAGRMVAGQILKRFVSASSGKFGQQCTMATLEELQGFRKAIEARGYKVFPWPDVNDAFLVGRALFINRLAPKWVWLEEIFHMGQPAVRAGATRNNPALRKAAEQEAKSFLLKSAEALGLNAADIAAIKASAATYGIHL